MNNKKVIGIPKLSGEPKPICGECMKGKQTQSSHKKVKEIKTTRPLDLYTSSYGSYRSHMYWK